MLHDTKQRCDDALLQFASASLFGLLTSEPSRSHLSANSSQDALPRQKYTDCVPAEL